MEYAKSILWVDDDIDKLGTYVEALKGHGFNVTTAISSEEALKICSNQRNFDIILVDIRMPNPNGIELLRRIYPEYKNALFGVLSSFLYLPKYRAQIKSLDFKVEIIDKDLPGIEDADFYDRFIKPIKDITTNGITNTIDSNVQIKSSDEKDPFAIEFHDFMRRQILEKDLLTDLAQKIASQTINNVFREGNIWVLLCGSKDIIRASAKDYSQILPEKAILDYALTLGRAPFQFFRPSVHEDMWSGCKDEFSYKNYPTVTLEINDLSLNKPTKKIVAHFDTGSPVTVFSYEELRAINAIPPATFFANDYAVAGGRPGSVRSVLIKMKAQLKCQETGSTRKIDILGRAIRNWEDSVFQIKCNWDNCHLRQEGNEELLGCPERVALIGRDLLTHNNLKLVLNGHTKQTAIYKSKE